MLTPSTRSATTWPNIETISALAVGRILDHIVQNRGDQRVGVELEIGEDVGDRDRMGDVGLTRHALLALMALGAEVVGFAHALDLRGGQIAFELI